ncbi:non-hydrolyzing UDP-N-acetylglucosamine 2-epimerase [Herbaspirillum sp. RV1423]|uniref:non-hydrolyzing UDP-N-acetylglucosamine 2-epimerase n=1 Tax=Herbaspirillum sp. RV1423 TaxID=1443993 RepID=UPI0004B57F7E
MAPVVRQLAQAEGVNSVVCVTGQHRSMLQQVLDLFDIAPDHDLDVMLANQTLNGLCARLFDKIHPVLESERPDRILVHGDTTTATIAAMAAFHQRIPVAHVEAGLRTGNLSQPWPEEMNRRVVDVIGDYLFAPTRGAAENLRGENLSGHIIVTGNTVIDALHMTIRRINQSAELQQDLDTAFAFLGSGRKILLVTGHRRENFGTGFAEVCEALATLSQRDDIDIVYPVHLNPNVRGPVQQMLAALPNVHLIEPLDYLHFVRLMQHAHVVLTDSGGVQEEAPALGKPVLVMRDVTERPEAVASGTVRLVGTGRERIIAEVGQLFDSPQLHAEFSHKANPYGDGEAAARIAAALTGKSFIEFQSYSVSHRKPPGQRDISYS